MRISIIALCVIGHAVYTYQDETTPKVEVLRNEYDRSPDGSYHWVMETDNGMMSEAKGELKKGPDGNVTLTVQGSNTYVAPNGLKMALTYTADENGYHPVGDMLPTPPPIPDYIQRAIDFIASKTKQEVTNNTLNQ